MPRAPRARARGSRPRFPRDAPSACALRRFRREARRRISRQLAVADGPRLDDALLAVGERDEGAELHDLRVAEVLPQPRPDALVRALGVPDEHARVEERRLLPLAEPSGALEVQ